MKSKLGTAAVVAAAIAPAVVWAAPAQAQQQIQEIIVTARKRQESILNVPVVETALPQKVLDRLQVTDLKDVATLAPGLAIGDNLLSIGAEVSVRGVGTTASDPGVDQSVLLNVDGLSLGNGLAFVSGLFDAGQIEVLKGPQALFYGKSSTGGVISVRTADPTSTPEIIARAGYEFEARERRGELIVSGPITDTLKGRLAGYVASQDGFFENIVTGPLPPLGAAPALSRFPQQRNWMVRGTLLWTPTSHFDARLKINNVYDHALQPGVLQLGQCPTGTTPPVFGIQFLNPNDNCRLDRKASWIALNPAAFPGTSVGSLDFVETTQTYGTLELNYRPTSALTVTSVTAYYLLHSGSQLQAGASFSGPSFDAVNGFRRREVTEELRVNSDFAGPLNFTAGAFFERGRVSDLVSVYGNTFLGLPPDLQSGVNIVHIDTDSVLGQLRYKIIPRLELAAGGRWTHETRSDFPILYEQVGLPASALGYQVKPQPRIGSDTISPEFTASYKPSDDVTIFGSYKKAYKSGSFSIGTPPVAGVDNSFHDEKVTGGELGFKSLLLDRTLLFNMAAYSYDYSGLQVGAIVPTTNGIPVTSVVNAGSAKVRGVEGEIVYRPPQLEHLSLHANVEYNHAWYEKLTNVPCAGGQTIAQGCNLLFSAALNGGTGGFSAQDDSGLPLVRAAKWQTNFGFDWETDLGDGMKLIVANSQQYSSKMLVNLGEVTYQPAFIKSDLSLTLQGPRDRWEVALIGKDLNNAITTGTCINSNLKGGLLPGSQITGGVTSGPAGPDQISCLMDRGREVWIRFTYRPLSR